MGGFFGLGKSNAFTPPQPPVPIGTSGEVLTVTSGGGLAFEAGGGGGSTSYTTLTYAATLAPASSSRAYWRCTLTGNVTIGLPTSPTDGDRAYFWLYASGAARTVALNAAIIIPTSSTFVSPATIQSGQKLKLMIEYDGDEAAWELTSLANGY